MGKWLDELQAALVETVEPEHAAEAPIVFSRVRVVRQFEHPWNERGEGIPSCYEGEPHYPAWAYHGGYERLLCTRCHPSLFREPVGEWRGLPVYHLDFRPERPCETCGKTTWGNLPGVGVMCWTCKTRLADIESR